MPARAIVPPQEAAEGVQRQLCAVRGVGIAALAVAVATDAGAAVSETQALAQLVALCVRIKAAVLCRSRRAGAGCGQEAEHAQRASRKVMQGYHGRWTVGEP